MRCSLHILGMLFLMVLVFKASAQRYCKTCRSQDSTICNNNSIGAFPCQNTTDRCYVRNVNGVIDRGCLQDIMIDADRQPCLDQSDSSCLSCAESVCNGEIWPSCHVCQESTDPSCRGPQLGEGTFCEKFSALSSCFERIVNSKVERGCRSDLVHDLCDESKQCHTCNESDCNRKSVQEFQITKCVQCRADDSDLDESCLSGSKGAMNCVEPSDGSCYSRILDDGILERGCQGNWTLDEVERCNGTICEICHGNSCNDGVFPVDRLTCNQCMSSNTPNCHNELTDTSNSVICKIFIRDNKCYSQVVSNQTFERGCLSDLSNSYCDENDNCIQCTGNNCNSISEQTILNYPRCLKCTSDDDGCFEGTITSVKCDVPDDSCYTRVNNGVLERNCLSTLSPADRTKCSAVDDESCVVCNLSGCNNHRWPTCHACVETSNSTCPEEQSGSGSFCKNYKEQADCFEQFVQGKVQRGCVSDLNTAVDPCVINEKCKSCTGNACNKHESRQFQNVACLQCTADEIDTDENCLLGTQVPQSCEDRSNGGCYSWINDAGILVRGCQSDIENITQCSGTRCTICGGEGCNGGIFPQNRLECYQCKGGDCAEESTPNSTSTICRIYKTNNRCYSRISEEGVFERGCQYDLINGSSPCSGLKNCILCTGSNCNSISETQMKQHPKCLRCTSDDLNCVNGLTNATSCDHPDDSCFTRVSDEALERNCLSTLSDLDLIKCNSTENKSCKICSINGCNSQNWHKCHQCSGTDCNSAQPTSKSQFCPQFNLQMCYEKLEAINVTRGCANDLIEDPCKYSLECRLCNTESCNGNPANLLVTDQRCLQCNTTLDTDGICLEGKIQAAPCRTESGRQCYASIDNDGVLQRGCLGDLSRKEIVACSEKNNCTICSGIGCNSNVYPENRLQCHQCNSLTDENCSKQLVGNASAVYCKTYSQYDYCYTRIFNGSLERGCQSDLKSSACDTLDKKHCQTCETVNCNRISETKLKNSAEKLCQILWISVGMFTIVTHMLWRYA